MTNGKHRARQYGNSASWRLAACPFVKYSDICPARNLAKLDDFMQEVGNACVYDGVHFRNSTEVGTAMGKQVGALAVAKFLQRSEIPGRFLESTHDR